MAWDQIDDNRWRWIPDEPTPDRQLLYYGNGTFAEMHRDNLHLYTQPEGVPVDPVWPLTDAVWSRSDKVPEPATDEDAWPVLAAAVEDPTP